MAITKSQLPMIRSLKTIAKRKSQQWPDVPDQVKEQIQKNQDKRNAWINRERKRYIARLPVSHLRCYMMRQNNVPLEEAQQKMAQEVIKDLTQIGMTTNFGATTVTTWQQAEQARYRALFNELEAAELKIIAGEAIDLAPFTVALKP